jgi:hypothetical protein
MLFMDFKRSIVMNALIGRADATMRLKIVAIALLAATIVV